MESIGEDSDVAMEVKGPLVDPSTLETQPMEIEYHQPSAKLPEDRRQAAQVAAAAREASAEAKAKAKAAANAAEEPQEAAQPAAQGGAGVAQVPYMLDGGVPVPPEFKGDKKSYTVPKPDNASDECGSIGVLWATWQLYVNKAITCEAGGRSFNVNKKDGITLSVRKLGDDWARAWVTAKKLAGWPDENPDSSNSKKKCFLST
ncbi:unnamed protein product [Symbiodinium sp. KB8]|nr:unnamed protein product [Symbiodinium sp. KB8]